MANGLSAGVHRWIPVLLARDNDGVGAEDPIVLRKLSTVVPGPGERDLGFRRLSDSLPCMAFQVPGTLDAGQQPIQRGQSE